MKFSTNEDIEAPIEKVFEMFTDFGSFERSALRRGADVRRTDKMRAPGVGMCWKALFEMRGKKRDVDIELTRYDPAEGLIAEGKSTHLGGTMTVDLVPLSRKRTRAAISFEVKPSSLSGRLIVQSLRLGKTRLTRRYKVMVAEYAKELEHRYKTASQD